MLHQRLKKGRCRVCHVQGHPKNWKEQEVKLRKEWMEINLGAKVLLFCCLDKGAANRMFAI